MTLKDKNIENKKKEYIIMKILVHLHLYYIEQTDMLLNKLCCINYPYDLFVTMSEKNKEIEQKIRKLKPDAKIIYLENIGADIYPFIEVLNQVDLSNYNYLVKIHTKRFVDTDYILPTGFPANGHIWRDYLLSFLTIDNFSKIMAEFEKDKTLGMVCDWRVLLTEYERKNTDAETTKMTLNFMEKRGICSKNITYPAGTMFVSRAKPFQIIKDWKLSKKDFSEFKSGKSCELPHCCEQLLGSIFLAQGYDVKDVYHSEIEKLLQSIDNKLKIPPAVNSNQTVRYKLFGIIPLLKIINKYT